MKSVKISLNLPERWQELTDDQLYYVYNLLSDNLSPTQVKTYCFFRWSGIVVLGRYADGWEVAQGKLRGFLRTGLIAAAIHVLDWIDTLPDTPVRLTKIKGHRAIDATLQDPNFPGWDKAQQPDHRFTFEKYIFCDNLYQGFLETQRHDLLNRMAQLLYDDPDITLSQPEKVSIFYWWASIKSLFSRTFCNFLTPMSTETVVDGSASLARQLQEATNAQIRALTGGDITKHRQVLDMDVWTAMWELDAKAKEANEFNAKYGK